MSIENEVLCTVDFTEVINEFATVNGRCKRFKLQYYFA
jgi:hypothetical protein